MKQLPPSCAIIITSFFLLMGITTFAQSGKISGTIGDTEGLPLPGVNIVIQGKNIGTQTDFDGNYSIQCDVGDILVISYIGQQTREVKVTAAMFGQTQIATAVKKIPVETILDTTYQSLVRRNLPSFLRIPNLEGSSITHNGKRYINGNRIKKISLEGNNINVVFLKPDVFYEIGWSSKIGRQFIQSRNLPETQNKFVQGIPLNGLNTHQGPETGTIFSYGPVINSLAYDGSDYLFDHNGRLVQLGEGNGQTPITYNDIPYKSITKTYNSVFFNVSTQRYFFSLDYSNTSGKDVFDFERSKQNEIALSASNSQGYNDFNWDVQLKHIELTENQPNINGFQNNLLFNALATPKSFSNAQGIRLPDQGQRSFSPMNFNNPLWLLNNNRNQITNAMWFGVLYFDFDIAHNASLKSKFSYTNNHNREHFGLPRNSIGFVDGYSSDKLIKNDILDANIIVDWDVYLGSVGLDVSTSLNFYNEDLGYKLVEQTEFDNDNFSNPLNTSEIAHGQNRSTFRWQTKLNFKFLDNRAEAIVLNNAFSSTLQNRKWFLPTFQLKYNFSRGWTSDFLRKLSLSASLGYDVLPTNLYYENQSHNSLQLLPSESLGYTSNNDLFASDAIDLEERENYEMSLDIGFRMFEGYWNLNTTYYVNNSKGSVFPIWENNRYHLRNIADVKNSGIEWTFEGNSFDYEGIKFSPKIVFSTYRTKVLEIRSITDRIPIAGFSSISQNLIKGESAGVLLGTTYATDAQKNRVIDSEGFPIIHSDLAIIGDPTPDFNIGFSSTMEWKGFELNFVFDYQKGGDIWNGTQNVLNYLGTSQQSAKERNIEGFVFPGVNEQGEINATPVDFANPANGIEGNRFVRYGFEGVGSDAIVDGSYLNLKSVNLSYSFKSKNENPFFRQVRIAAYGHNLFTTSKYKGASPYSSMYDQVSSKGLNFFNTPIRSEIGVKVNFKI